MLGLAVFDLVVGVSNDAVNFLSSAVGSQAATFRTIMIVASAGILVGAVSSGGMMEVAKKGIFNPSFFTFQNVMFIYVVVMLTDIFLLDFFNSMKLPTSTTISIVFELLGASLAISFLKVYQSDLPVSEWLEYINTTKALEMIIAIFVSVAVAFAVGWLVQYILRAFVTFEYKKYMKVGGAVFGGISVAVVLNFIINVGLKNSPLRHSGAVQFAFEQIGWVYAGAFILAFLYFFVKASDKKFDTFRAVALIGTFALAMAFASNDLVNFIGVPISSLEAFSFWKASAADPDAYTMEVFSGEAAQTNAEHLFLMLAGVIMILTLWLSKKARNVIQTTVNLSSQAEGVERFNGNELSRNVVRFVGAAANGVSKLVPASLRSALERRYKLTPPVGLTKQEQPPAAFDLVRASVILIVAASLISLGTSLKLPLSTTYVSFMVVMGTSLADRAWNRDSAVYRVAGVFTVIGGWFVTAISALTLSAIFAIIVYNLEFAGIGLILVLVVSGIYLVNRHTDNELQLKATVEFPDAWFEKTYTEIQPDLKQKVKDISKAYIQGVEAMVHAILREDRKAIKDIEKRLSRQGQVNFYYRATLNQQLRSVKAEHLATAKALLEFYVQENELLKELSSALRVAKRHILNMHLPLDEPQAQYLSEFVNLLKQYDRVLHGKPEASVIDLEAYLQAINEHVEKCMMLQIHGLAKEKYSFKNSRLFVTTLIRQLNASNTIHRMYLITEMKEKELWSGI